MQIGHLVAQSLPKVAQTSVVDRLEQAFLEEMLKYYGPRNAEGAFSGGAGEAQFASLLAREHAAILASRLDLGFGKMLAGAAS